MVLPRLRTSFEILARANGTPTEELDRAWEEVQLSVAKGGSNIDRRAADVADACFVAAFLAVWPSLRESQGGIAPPTKRIIHNFAKEVGCPSAVDRTDYGTASGSARGFVQHHSQQLSRAAVCGDAQNINNAARNMRVAHSFMTGLNAPLPCARAF